VNVITSCVRDLYTLIPDGDASVRAVIELWGLRWPEGE
jgi:hypothetical protein